MPCKRKYSIFVSSTYEDLKVERQAILGVALENDFIPVGMEQFHAAPADQWSVITKMIDECDFYLLVVGGCYGSIDPDTDISYTEKEYDYAKSHNIPVLVFIEIPDKISVEKMDKEDRNAKQIRLDSFRNKVKSDGNTVDFFEGILDLKYRVSSSLKKSVEFVGEDLGWVRYLDVQSIINNAVLNANKNSEDNSEKISTVLESMQVMLTHFSKKLSEMMNNQLSWEEIPTISEEDIDRLFDERYVK